MALIDEFNSAQDATLRSKVQASAVNFCIAIIESEATNTPNHENRITFARNVVLNPDTFAPQLTLGVTTLLGTVNPSTPTDTDINNSIAAIWNMYAGLN